MSAASAPRDWARCRPRPAASGWDSGCEPTAGRDFCSRGLASYESLRRVVKGEEELSAFAAPACWRLRCSFNWLNEAPEATGRVLRSRKARPWRFARLVGAGHEVRGCCKVKTAGWPRTTSPC